MGSLRVAHVDDSRVRFVFNEAVRFFSASADTTFAEIAEMLDQLANPRFGDPVAIEVKK